MYAMEKSNLSLFYRVYKAIPDNPTAMNPASNTYDPATDENQGIMTTMIQADEASEGVSQVARMSPVENQGPEPVKEEVNESDTDANGVNNAVLAEEDVEAGNATVDVDYEDGDN